MVGVGVGACVLLVADNEDVIDSRHGPSFQRLYPDAMNRIQSEQADWYSTLVDRLPDPPAWADVVLDMRARWQDHFDTHGEACRVSGGDCDNGREGPLPDLPDHPTEVWQSLVPGWSLEGFVVDRPHRRIHVLRFTDPDGFRAAFVTSGKDAKRPDEAIFEPGRFITMFPTAARTLLHPVQRRHDPVTGRLTGGTDERHPLVDAPPVAVEDEVAAIASGRYRFPILRDALKNPAGWFGLDREDDWQALTCPPAGIHAGPSRESQQRWLPDAMGHDCPVGSDRVLLAYAMAGVSSYAPVQHFVAAGLDPAELARYRWADGSPDEPQSRPRHSDDHLLAWFSAVGGGNKARACMANFEFHDVPVETASRWIALGPSSNAYAGLVKRFEAAGWGPEDVLRMQRRLNFPHGSPPLHVVASSTHSWHEVAAWMFTAPQAALAFATCDYDVDAAHRSLLDADDPAQVEAAVVTMAALREPKTMALH